MSVKLLTEHHLEFRSLKAGSTGSSESVRVQMPHCWKSSVTAHIVFGADPVGLGVSNVFGDAFCLHSNVNF